MHVLWTVSSILGTCSGVIAWRYDILDNNCWITALRRNTATTTMLLPPAAVRDLADPADVVDTSPAHHCTP
jgi:hypothetical protein